MLDQCAASREYVELVGLKLICDEVVPARDLGNDLIYHVAEDERIFIAKLVNQVGQQPDHIDLTVLFVEL